MKSNDATIMTEIVIAAFIGGFFLGSFVLSMVAENGIASMQKEAIEAGVAKWSIDEKTGKSSFIYIKENKGE